jgi:hypothetical protein
MYNSCLADLLSLSPSPPLQQGEGKPDPDTRYEIRLLFDDQFLRIIAKAPSGKKKREKPVDRQI